MAIKIGKANSYPANTIYGDDVAASHKLYFLADGAITPGAVVQFNGASDLVIAAASGTATHFIGIAGDNEGIETSYGTAVAYNTAYVALDSLPVIYAGTVKAISDGTTTLGYPQIVDTTAGYCTDGSLTDQTVPNIGLALETEQSAGAGGVFMLWMRGV
jgi:hypothetical protein